jgi:membrane protein involved in colicin uptake
MLGRIAGALVFSLFVAAAPVHAEGRKPTDPRVAKASEQMNMAIQACWNRPDFKGKVPVVTLKVLLAKDGSLIGSPHVLRPKKSKVFKAIADSAIRAVNRCAPFSTVPENPDLYEDLKEIYMNFHSPAL